MFLNTDQIRKKYSKYGLPLIGDMVKEKVRELNGRPVVSYGLSENSYDIRLAPTALELPNGFNLVNEKNKRILTPKYSFSEKEATLSTEPKIELEEFNDGVGFRIPPYTMVLGHSVEYFNIPNNITGFLYCKSTYARIGMNMAPTVLKSGWSGQLVLEICNQTDKELIVYANEGIGSVYFTIHEENMNIPIAIGYSGKFQHQTEIVHALSE